MQIRDEVRCYETNVGHPVKYSASFNVNVDMYNHFLVHVWKRRCFKLADKHLHLSLLVKQYMNKNVFYKNSKNTLPRAFEITWRHYLNNCSSVVVVLQLEICVQFQAPLNPKLPLRIFGDLGVHVCDCGSSVKVLELSESEETLSHSSLSPHRTSVRSGSVRNTESCCELRFIYVFFLVQYSSLSALTWWDVTPSTWCF